MVKLKREEKLNPETRISILFDLIEAFKNIKGSADAANFLEDLLTPNEINNISVRLRIAKLLLSGATQRTITRDIHTSLATVNKVNIWLDEGGEGFKKIISRLPAKWTRPDKLPKGPIEFHLPELAAGMIKYSVASKQEAGPKQLIKKMARKKIIDKQLNEFNRQFYSIRSNRSGHKVKK